MFLLCFLTFTVLSCVAGVMLCVAEAMPDCKGSVARLQSLCSTLAPDCKAFVASAHVLSRVASEFKALVSSSTHLLLSSLVEHPHTVQVYACVCCVIMFQGLIV
jgi:hypothetical protein